MEERGLCLLTCPDHSPPLWGSQGRGVKQPAVPQSREEGSEGRCARLSLARVPLLLPTRIQFNPPCPRSDAAHRGLGYSCNNQGNLPLICPEPNPMEIILH